MRRREFLLCGPALIASKASCQEVAAAAIAQYERSSGGHVGYYAVNFETGRTMSWRADERFVMCSTFKASLGALILRHVDLRQDDLDARIAYGPSDIQDWWAPVAKANLQKGGLTVREMCEAAVEQSDNTCASLLLERVGGPSQITAFWRSLGDDTSRLDAPEPYLNRTSPGRVENTTTPRAMAGTLRTLVLGNVLADGSRRTLTDWLVGGKTGADRLRSGLPGAWTTGDKTGNNGADAAGDIAVTWTPSGASIVMAAYTRGGSPTAEQFKAVFQGVGRLIAAGLAGDGVATRSTWTPSRTQPAMPRGSVWGQSTSPASA